MKENSIEYYADLGENPASPTQRKIALIAFWVTLLLFLIFKTYDAIRSHNPLEYFSIYLVLIAVLWRLSRPYHHSKGKYFIKIDATSLEYLGFGTTKVQKYLLKDIEGLEKESHRIKFRVFEEYWQSLSTLHKTQEVFDHLQKAIQARTNSNVM